MAAPIQGTPGQRDSPLASDAPQVTRHDRLAVDDKRDSAVDERELRADLLDEQGNERVAWLFAQRSDLEERANQVLERSAQRLVHSHEILDLAQTLLSRAEERLAVSRAATPMTAQRRLGTGRHRSMGPIGSDP